MTVVILGLVAIITCVRESGGRVCVCVCVLHL